MTALYSLGLGVGTQNGKNEWLEVFYPRPHGHSLQQVAMG